MTSGGRKELEGDGRRLGPQGGERFGSQSEVLEDLRRHIGLLDAGDEAHLALTARTLKHIDAEDPLQLLCPPFVKSLWRPEIGLRGA